MDNVGELHWGWPQAGGTGWAEPPWGARSENAPSSPAVREEVVDEHQAGGGIWLIVPSERGELSAARDGFELKEGTCRLDI